MSESNKEIKEVSVRLLTGILSNPNYNFNDIKTAVKNAVEHAKALILKVSESVENVASNVAKVADKIGDAARGHDDDLPAGSPGGPPAKVEKTKTPSKPADPLAGI